MDHIVPITFLTLFQEEISYIFFVLCEHKGILFHLFHLCWLLLLCSLRLNRILSYAWNVFGCGSTSVFLCHWLFSHLVRAVGWAIAFGLFDYLKCYILAYTLSLEKYHSSNSICNSWLARLPRILSQQVVA